MGSIAKFFGEPRDYKNLRISESGKLIVDQRTFLRDEKVRQTVESVRTVKSDSKPPKK